MSENFNPHSYTAELAKKITDELFECDGKESILGADMRDPDYAGIRKVIAEVLQSHGPNDEQVWLEDELMAFVRLCSPTLYGKDQKQDEITDALRLHGMRLMVEAEIDRYGALLERVNKRVPATGGGDK